MAEHPEMQELQDVIEELLDDGEVQGLVHTIALKHLGRPHPPERPLTPQELDDLAEDDAYWSTVGLIMTTTLSRIAGRQYYAWDGATEPQVAEEFDLDEGCECEDE